MKRFIMLLLLFPYLTWAEATPRPSAYVEHVFNLECTGIIAHPSQTLILNNRSPKVAWHDKTIVCGPANEPLATAGSAEELCQKLYGEIYPKGVEVVIATGKILWKSLLGPCQSGARLPAQQ